MFHYLKYIFGKNEARKKGSDSEKMVRSVSILCFECIGHTYHLLTFSIGNDVTSPFGWRGRIREDGNDRTREK